ncbi:hypothetical protein D3C78_1104660 [compost metagenome]
MGTVAPITSSMPASIWRGCWSSSASWPAGAACPRLLMDLRWASVSSRRWRMYSLTGMARMPTAKISRQPQLSMASGSSRLLRVVTISPPMTMPRLWLKVCQLQ